MRLFIAILFDKMVTDALFQVEQAFAAQAVSGNFTRYENLHLTLAFLGETPQNRCVAVREAMQACITAPFSLLFEEFGAFRDLYWVGAAPSAPLTLLQKRLAGALRERGFALEDRPFRPHITLGRQIVLPAGFSVAAFRQSLSRTPAAVQSISLMRSERIDGRLRYTQVDSLPLRRN